MTGIRTFQEECAGHLRISSGMKRGMISWKELCDQWGVSSDERLSLCVLLIRFHVCGQTNCRFDVVDICPVALWLSRCGAGGMG